MIEKGEIKTWGTPGTDLWLEDRRFVFRLHKGWHVRPVKPLRYWLDRSYNCWQGDMPWFVLRFPIIFFFLSVKIGKGGFYIGCKVYEYDIQNKYRYWWFPEEWPFGEYLALSVRIARLRNG